MGGLGDDEGDVVVGGEMADVGDDGVEEGLGGLGAVAAEGFDQAVFAELVAGFVEGFGDAVGVEGQGLAVAEGALAEFAVSFFENAEDRGGGVSRRVFLAGSRRAGRWQKHGS
jgi:hypothetical protein